MKRTTIFLDEALERRLKQRARREGKSFAMLVREAVAAYLAGPPRTPPGTARGLPSWVGMFDSGHSDTAERFEDLLYRDDPR